MYKYFILLLSLCSGIFAQNAMGVSSRIDLYPYFKLEESGGMNGKEAEIKPTNYLNSLAFPILLRDKKLIIINKLEYQKTEFHYNNLHSSDELMIDKVESLKYRLIVIDSLSKDYTFLGVLIPGIGSDFRGKITSKDIIFEGQAGIIRNFRKNLSIGTGITYGYDYFFSYPLPFIFVNWSTPKSILIANLPGMINYTWKFNDHFDTGLNYNYIYERFHGRKGSYCDENLELIKVPMLRHSAFQLSQSFNYHYNTFIHLSVESGMLLKNTYNFDDKDENLLTFRNDCSPYISVYFTLGI